MERRSRNACAKQIVLLAALTGALACDDGASGANTAGVAAGNPAPEPGGTAGTAPAGAGNAAMATGAGSSAMGPGNAGTGGPVAGTSAAGTGGSEVAGASGGGTAGAPSAGASGSGDAGTPDAGGGAECTRELLADAVDAYFVAMAAHDPTMAPIAPDAKFTEDGEEIEVGEGLWQTAGMPKLKRSALDEVQCISSTESVVPESGTDRIFGLRLKLEAQQITEIESIIVREGDYLANNPRGLLGSADDDWETPLPPEEQTPREEMQRIVAAYFEKFPSGGCGFSEDCVRLENGQSFGNCVDGFIVRCDPNARDGDMYVRLIVLDTTAGIGSGLTLWRDTYADLHLFKIRDGAVHGVHAILSRAPASGWD